MIIMKFTKEFLLCIVFDDFYDDMNIKVISNTFVDSRRWVNEYRMVFKYEDKFYSFTYDVPATEGQDGCGYFEYYRDDELIDVTEVHPVEKTIIVYE